MVTVLNFKPIVDLPKWRPLATPISFNINAGYPAFNIPVSDLRNNEDRHPLIYYLTGPNRTFAYNVKNDEWIEIGDQGGSGLGINDAFLMPAQGPRGTLAAGATTTTITLSTVLPASVGVNQLANRGDGRGFKIRIIGNAAGSSGKTEERLIIGNTSGTTPIVTLDSALSFTPILGDSYEILSGRIYYTNRFITAWRRYDIATNSFTGLAASPLGVETVNLVGLDESFIPYNKNPGEGYFGTLIATATGAASLTGQVVGGDANVLANEFRNFQIRIIEDTGIPTATGQRRNIISHTVGSPIYTVPAWTVTPSATAKYVIENNGDRIIEWAGGGFTTTATYTISTNTWDSNITFAARPTTLSSGAMAQQAFAIVDTTKNARPSFIYSFRGGGTNTLDLFDISGAATGTWTSDIVYGNKGTTTFSTASSHAYDSATNQGRYMHINQNSTQRFIKFDIQNRVLDPSTFLKVPIAVQNIFGQTQRQLVYTVFVDGNTKLSFLIFIGANSAITTGLSFALPIIE